MKYAMLIILIISTYLCASSSSLNEQTSPELQEQKINKSIKPKLLVKKKCLAAVKSSSDKQKVSASCVQISPHMFIDKSQPVSDQSAEPINKEGWKWVCNNGRPGYWERTDIDSFDYNHSSFNHGSWAHSAGLHNKGAQAEASFRSSALKNDY